ncbi:probable glutamate--tRNA ligase, mitochondrial [Ostrea edulis]|uniref:probable glutamate--tRNA ligase, mitochondrial n=1 Tax=Ostrea edulis TaxID=37623 RepID=UPI0024AF73BF|nr:probable glutamate--tRNA ligase, mitochondrial [Ostrea edulis]
MANCRTVKVLSMPIRRQIRRRFNTTSIFGDNRSIRVRFAPSPTGYMHLGSLRTAFYNYLFAKSNGGTMILRIEDTDQTRLVDGAIEKIIETLHWANLEPDEGPLIGGDCGPYIQSQRTEFYNKYLDEVLQTGAAYKCYCSKFRLDLIRKDAIKRGETPKYDNRCRHLTEREVQEQTERNTPYVVRFKLKPEDHELFTDLVYGPYDVNIADNEGDPIIMKSDGLPTYHFANVVDDHMMGITHVLRGQEWQMSTPKHLLMYKAFGWSPPEFGHLPLIMNSDGTKLSKRQGDIQISYYQKKGYSPEALLKFMTLMGGGYTQTEDNSIRYDSMKDLIEKFSIKNMSTSAGHVDHEKLEQVNKIYLKRALQDNPDLVTDMTLNILRKHLQTIYSNEFANVHLDKEHVASILQWSLRENRINKVADLTEPEWDFLWNTPSTTQIQELCENSYLNVSALLQDCCTAVNQMSDFTESSLKKSLSVIAEERGIKLKVLLYNLRVSLSGLKVGPPVIEMMNILGRNTTLSRLKHAEQCINNAQCVGIKK